VNAREPVSGGGNGPVIIGIGVGAGVLVVLIALIIVFVMRRKKKTSSSYVDRIETSVADQALITNETYEEWETMPTMYATEVVDDHVFQRDRE
jgi:hypothetical protein